jgi:zinc protease
VRSVVQETQGTDLVAVQIWVRAGSRYENDANNGAARLIQSLALSGSKSYPRTSTGGAEEAIGALGGTVGSLTARDSTFYSATVAASFLPAALRILSDATLHPDLSDAAVEETKLDVESDLMRRAFDPVASASDLSYRAAFSKHPYRRPSGGTAASVAALTGGPVRAYHRARYVGANISVVIVGDVQRDAAHKLVASFFGGAAASKGPAPAISTEAAPAFRQIRRPGGTPLGTLSLAFRSPGIQSPSDVVAMDVLLAYWKEGSDAALRRVLRASKFGPDAMGDDNAPAGEGENGEEGDKGAKPDEEEATPKNSQAEAPESQPLALAFDVDFLTQRDPGLFIISIVEPSNKDEAIDAIWKEIKSLQQSGIEDKALAEAKRVLTQQYVQQSETVSGLAGALGFYEMIDSYQFAVTYLDRVARVTPADIKRIANKYFSSKSYIQATIDPLPNQRPRPRPPEGGETIIAALPR